MAGGGRGVHATCERTARRSECLQVEAQKGWQGARASSCWQGGPGRKRVLHASSQGVQNDHV